MMHNRLQHLWAARWLAFCLLLTALSAAAVIETYEFDDDVTRERYNQFTEELRCPQCQNQNLSGSNSSIAKDLRRELYRLLQEGHSDQQIVEYMVNRYGDFILYRPRFNTETAVLWLAPALFLLLGAIVLVAIAVKQRKKNIAVAADNNGLSLDAAERERLDNLLGEDNADQGTSGASKNG